MTACYLRSSGHRLANRAFCFNGFVSETFICSLANFAFAYCGIVHAEHVTDRYCNWKAIERCCVPGKYVMVLVKLAMIIRKTRFHATPSFFPSLIDT